MGTAAQGTAQVVSDIMSLQATPVSIANAASSLSANPTSALLSALGTIDAFATVVAKSIPGATLLVGSLSLTNDIYAANAEFKANGSISNKTYFALAADLSALLAIAAISSADIPVVAAAVVASAAFSGASMVQPDAAAYTDSVGNLIIATQDLVVANYPAVSDYFSQFNNSMDQGLSDLNSNINRGINSFIQTLNSVGSSIEYSLGNLSQTLSNILTPPAYDSALPNQTTSTGTGMVVPSQIPVPGANYTVLNNGDGTFALFYSNGVTYSYSKTLQQWSVPDSNGDGGTTIYSRNVVAGFAYGDWTVQQNTLS